MLSNLGESTVIAGDFNQRTPRVTDANRAAAEALDAAFAPTTIVTAGTPTGTTRPGIDHIAVAGRLRATSVWGWPHVVDGVRFSDHDGAGVELTLGT